MRILVATHQWFPDYTGGSARVATETARHLAARGHDVTVLAPRNQGPEEERTEGVLVRRVIRRGATPQTWTDATEAWRYARRLRGERFDVVLAHHPTVAVGVVRARLAAPLVFVYHASVVRELQLLRTALPMGAQRLATYVLGPSLAVLERAAIARAERVLVLSEYSGSLVREDHAAAAGRISRAPGGVDPEEFAPAADRDSLRRRLGLEPGTPLVLTARRLDPCLGLEAVVEAVARVAGEPVLAVAGEGPLAPRLRELAGAHGLGGRLRMLGARPPAELREWFVAADLFVLSPAPHEGFGMVTVEALASGTPVVAAPLGATPELLEPLDPGLLASGADPGAMATAIESALDRPGEAIRARCRGYATDRFAWRHAIRAWEEILSAAANSYRRD